MLLNPGRAGCALLVLGLVALQALSQQPTLSDAEGSVAERRSTLADQESLGVTIYNEDLALIKDRRKVALVAGINRLALREVSAKMRPETAQLRSISHPGSFTLLEQNFDFDLLTPAQLLEKYVGRSVRVIKTNPLTGVDTEEPAQVLSANGGVVLKMGDRIETGVPGRIVYPGVPATLRDRPTLVTELLSKQPASQVLELSYLTGGLSWHADYVAELDPDDNSLELNGWVTLTNRSGTTYPDAHLQLVAGDLNRVQDELNLRPRALAAQAAKSMPPATFAQETLFEYHLYSLERPTTLSDNQTKQVALFNASAVPVKKELLLEGRDYYYQASVGEIAKKLKTSIYVEFQNSEAGHLGRPLPKGVVRVYKADKSGNVQFVGEDRIDHTPKNERVRLHLGDAFDVTADKTQTDFRRREKNDKATYAYESAYEIVFRNAKPEAVQVTVREPIPGDWSVIQESQAHTKLAAGTAEWRVSVPAEGTASLRYRVSVRY